MSGTPPPTGGPSEHVSDENSEVQVDIPDVDISHSGDFAEDISGVDTSQPDNSDVPLELDIPRLDESASSDPDLSSHLDSRATLGDDWPPSECYEPDNGVLLLDLSVSLNTEQSRIFGRSDIEDSDNLWTRCWSRN